MQAIDWHEGLTAARPAVEDEIKRMRDCPAAEQTLELAQMVECVRDWPAGGWERDDVQRRYRFGLLRGISAGHFLRSASLEDG